VSIYSVTGVNPLEPNVIKWLHFKCSALYRSNLPFLISDIWHSGASARVHVEKSLHFYLADFLDMLIFYIDKLMVICNSKNLHVFNFVILLKITNIWCSRNIRFTVNCLGIFTKFTILVQLGTKMNWLDFEIRQYVVKKGGGICVNNKTRMGPEATNSAFLFRCITLKANHICVKVSRWALH